MKTLSSTGVIAVLIMTAAAAAETFTDKSLGVAIEAPVGFDKSTDRPVIAEILGDTLAVYLPKDSSPGTWVMFHHMPVPDNATYDAFKSSFPTKVAEYFGAGFKLVKQEDLAVPKLTGFLLDFECPGDGTKPDPGGTIKEHVRWYFVRQGDSKLVGFLYHAREAAWKEVEPKFAASARTLKQAE